MEVIFLCQPIFPLHLSPVPGYIAPESGPKARFFICYGLRTGMAKCHKECLKA